MICAALGVDKGSANEADWLKRLESVGMTVLTIPRQPEETQQPLEIRRLEDFHTTGGGFNKKTHPQCIPRKASGGPCDNATLSTRQYLLDAKFGVILVGSCSTLEKVNSALSNPCWGVWFGRKNCIPAAPICRGGLKETLEEVLIDLGLAGKNLSEFFCVAEVTSFDEGTDTLMDVPVNFKTREFKPRRICQQPMTTKE